MSIFEDISKTIHYAGRNGLRQTFYAAGERLHEKVGASYSYEAPALETLQNQKREWESLEERDTPLPLISFLVPCWQPDRALFASMLDSVLSQTYQNFEIVIADASQGPEAEEIVTSRHSEKISYHRLSKNLGISGNTNAAAAFAAGSYVALLDYDDLLTPDCLCEVTREIRRSRAEIVYCDEDKCDALGKRFFEPNIKPDFNPDYFLANNYVCHLLVMKRELFLALKLRSEYDGAQDYDLLLRAPWSGIRHIPKVLYHWRIHAGSTAGNPASKDYAYEAGLRALQEHFRVCHIDAEVTHAKHRGFYRVVYRPDIFTARDDIGVVGGKVVDRRTKRIVGGPMDAEGNVLFEGLRETDSGPMHRADTVQDVPCVDARCMEIREELQSLYRTVFHADYDTHVMKPEEDLKKRSVQFCQAAREMGYLVFYDPEQVKYDTEGFAK